MTTPTITENSAAALIARFLKARGVDRVFALCGGHIMPMWMRLDAEGIRIVDVRDERAAVYMAHAHAELTGGLGVAMVTYALVQSLSIPVIGAIADAYDASEATATWVLTAYLVSAAVACPSRLSSICRTWSSASLSRKRL